MIIVLFQYINIDLYNCFEQLNETFIQNEQRLIIRNRIILFYFFFSNFF